MTISRRDFAVMTALATGAFLPLAVAAQPALDAIPEGSLRDHVTWFIDVLGDAGYALTGEEVEDRFSPEFLAQVPADQIIAVVEELRPALGEITVGRIAQGTDEHQAGVQLIGESGLRVLLTIRIDPESNLIGGLLIEPDTAATTPESTAVASAIASPVAIAHPPAMDEVLPAYEDVRDQLLSQGRVLTEALLAGDAETVGSLIAPDALVLLGEDFVSEYVEFIERIQVNVVHMEFPEVGAIFDGQVSEGEIRGFFHQGGPATFELMAAETQASDVPQGLWTGQIGAGGGALEIEVTFSGTAEALEAALTIPSQNLHDHALSNVIFEAERPLGELREERALPLGLPTNNYSYSAAYAWGESELVLSAAFNAEGLVDGLSTLAYPSLPPDPAGDVVTETAFHLPFEGAWMVIWGGDTEFLNYHAPVPIQRHAYDIVIWKDGATYTGDGTRNEHYHAWGQRVFAPAPGTVVDILDGQPDLDPNMISDPARAAELDPARHPAGNHVVIQTNTHEYVLIAHFQNGTIDVAKGDDVISGQVLGFVGSSGNSSEPHIHIHLQDVPDFYAPEAIGLPLLFTNFVANGVPVETGLLRQGELVAPED